MLSSTEDYMFDGFWILGLYKKEMEWKCFIRHQSATDFAFNGTRNQYLFIKIVLVIQNENIFSKLDIQSKL